MPARLMPLLTKHCKGSMTQVSAGWQKVQKGGAQSASTPHALMRVAEQCDVNEFVHPPSADESVSARFKRQSAGWQKPVGQSLASVAISHGLVSSAPVLTHALAQSFGFCVWVPPFGQ